MAWDDSFFRGKKITLIGLGLLGRGVGDAAFLAECGAELIVTDGKGAEELAPSVARLAPFPQITFHLGEHRMEDFRDRDMILRGPAVRPDSPFLREAESHGIPIEMDASLFARLSPTKRIIGITGTRGKSTVTHMIAEMLHAAGMRVFLGGNVRDTATLPLLRAITPDDTVVLELDSWQLQGFASADLSPWIAVWTNFMRDHMNYYANDMDRYFADKAAVAMHQKPGDFFVAPSEIRERVERLVGSLPSTWVAPRTLPPDLPLRIPGIHNRVNAGFAYTVGEILHLPDSVIRQSLTQFSGLPNRLQYLGEKHQIAYYNDSNATTPEATLAALDALAGKPLVLIAGGNDKESDYVALAQAIQKAVRALVLFKGAATEKLIPLLDNFPYTLVSSMPDAVRAAETLAHPGDTILLSPGATSFGIFKNEYDRGDQFIRAFESL